MRGSIISLEPDRKLVRRASSQHRGNTRSSLIPLPPRRNAVPREAGLGTARPAPSACGWGAEGASQRSPSSHRDSAAGLRLEEVSNWSAVRKGPVQPGSGREEPRRELRRLHLWTAGCVAGSAAVDGRGCPGCFSSGD